MRGGGIDRKKKRAMFAALPPHGQRGRHNYPVYDFGRVKTPRVRNTQLGQFLPKPQARRGRHNHPKISFNAYSLLKFIWSALLPVLQTAFALEPFSDKTTQTATHADARPTR